MSADTVAVIAFHCVRGTDAAYSTCRSLTSASGSTSWHAGSTNKTRHDWQSFNVTSSVGSN